MLRWDFLQYTKYSCEILPRLTGKSLASWHSSGYETDSN